MGWFRRLLGFEGRVGGETIRVSEFRVSYGHTTPPSYSGHCIGDWPPSNPATFSANYRATYRSDFLPIVGEHHCQAILRPAYAKSGDGYARSAVFFLRREGVQIRVMTSQLQPVGHLAAKDERAYQKAFDLLEPRYKTIWCEGWIEPAASGSGALNVALDLATASECIRRAKAGRNTAGTFRRSRKDADR